MYKPSVTLNFDNDEEMNPLVPSDGWLQKKTSVESQEDP
jgi:hypothetical protein